MAVTAGHVNQAQEFAQYVTENTDTTSNVGATTTETVSTSVTWTAFAGVRYKVTYEGAMESTIAGDGAKIRLRWQNSGTPGIGGTEFRNSTVYAEAANHTNGVVKLTGTFNAQAAGTLTVSATIIRLATATGTVKANGTVVPLYFLIEIIGPA